MKKFLLSLLCVLGVVCANAATKTATWDFRIKQSSFSSGMTLAMTDDSSEGTWTLTYEAGFTQSDATNGPKFGSTNAPLNAASLTLNNSEIPADAVISQVVFTVKGTAQASASSWNLSINGTQYGETQSASGNTSADLTWSGLSVTAGDDLTVNIALAEAGTAGTSLTSVAITYDDGTTATLGGITMSGIDMTSLDGTTFHLHPTEAITFGCENAEKMEVIVADNSDLGASAEASEIVWTAPEAEGTYSVTITATLGEDTKSLTFTFVVTEPSGKWLKVTSTDDLTMGGKYIIACISYEMAASTEKNSNNRKQIAVSFNDDKTQIKYPDTDGVLRIIPERILEDGSTYILWKSYNYDATSQGYLYSATGNNYLKCGTSTEDSYRNTTVAFDEDENVDITFVNCNSRTIRYNASSGIFAAYTSAQTDVQLFKWVENEATIETPVISADGTVLTATSVTLQSGESKTVTLAVENTDTNIYYSVTTDSTSAQADTESDYVPRAGFSLYSSAITVSAGTTIQYYAEKGGEETSVSTVVFKSPTTAISELSADCSDSEVVYDLSGRRVVAPTNGIYIVNGKKVLVK